MAANEAANVNAKLAENRVFTDFTLFTDLRLFKGLTRFSAPKLKWAFAGLQMALQRMATGVWLVCAALGFDRRWKVLGELGGVGASHMAENR